MGRVVDLAIGALNGALGHYLARTNNALATRMTLVHEGAPLPLEADAIRAAHPSPSPHLVVLVHGLMCTEDVFRFADGDDYGTLLARDLGFCPFYVRYNSGLPIADNGRQLSELLEALSAAYPVPIESIVLVGYSMGGLVVRSACHAGADGAASWLGLLTRAIYVGTPHRGAPLERYARTVAGLLREVDDPYAKTFVDLAALRSDGIVDLGDGLPLPLSPSVRHFLVAGTLSNDITISEMFGDALVPVPSATDGHVNPRTGEVVPDHVKVFSDVGHVSLAHHPDVYRQILAWCSLAIENEGSP